MNTIIAKFGGTSMGSAESISQVADIMQDMDGQRVAVVSAVSGVTDILVRLGEMAVAGEVFDKVLGDLVLRHDQILDDLNLDLDLSEYWEELTDLLKGIKLIRELSLSSNDRLLSFGERISSQILVGLLESQDVRSERVSAFNLIYTDNNFGEGNVDFGRTDSEIQRQLSALLDEGVIPVVTGFIAQAENGSIITLGRGGSDYTAAIIASTLDASELQIWTDVDGILNADPRIIEGAEVLTQLSFEEASELAYFGAKVLHPKTIKPAVQKNIPVRILNTFNPEAVGTEITNQRCTSIKSVTSKKDVTIVNICSTGMLNAHGFLAKIFDVFKRNEIVVDVVSTSEVSVSLTVDGGLPAEVIEKLSEIGSVDVINDMAIICLVGEGIRTMSGVLGQLFTNVNGTNVSMVSQGASQRNITFLVEQNEATGVIKNIYNAFFNQQNND